MTRAHALRPATCLVAAFLLSTAADAGTVTDVVEHTYSLRHGQVLAVSNVNGSITVEGWDRDEVHLRAEKKASGRSDSAARDLLERLVIDVDESRDGLRITTRQPSAASGWLSWLFGGGSNASVSYHLRVPRDLTLEVETTNGRITLADTGGEVTASTTNGAVTLDDVHGRVLTHSTNGSIKASLTAVEAGADLSFRTTNGSVSLALPPDVAATLRADTTNGRITCDLPLSDEQRRRTYLSGNVNGGGGTIDLRTTNGSIRIAAR